jgi:2-C-methyl-D-erythritol 4-phosphate cytidylyltransferase
LRVRLARAAKFAQVRYSVFRAHSHTFRQADRSMHSHRSRYFALIPAAGVGARMRSDGPKQYMELAGRPMLAHTVAAFLASARIAHTFIVVSADDGMIESVVAGIAGADDKVSVLRCGGATRMDSILNALQALAGKLAETDHVLVHDAARPGLTPALIGQLIDTVGDHPAGGLLALPVVDTVKQADGGALRTLPREGLWLAQTPQMFPFALLRKALESARAAGDQAAITDDASAIEALGLDTAPLLVEGHPCNLKVTLPRDIAIAAMYLAHAASIDNS